MKWRKRERAARQLRKSLKQLEHELGPVPADTPEQAAERAEYERLAAELPDEEEEP